MQSFDQQTLKDLEFTTIIKWLGEYAFGPTATKRIIELVPTNNFDLIEQELKKTHEFRTIRDVGESFPSLDFEELQEELKLLPKKNSVLSAEGFQRIRRASDVCNHLVYFFDKKEDDYPLLSNLLIEVPYTTELIEEIDKVFDAHGEVKDSASVLLGEIRGRLKDLRVQINKNFDRELKRLLKANLLGDTKEAFINDRRVLTVLASHKRTVSGNIVGSSKTGSLVFVEPIINQELNSELEIQLDEERKEIYRILKELTANIAHHFPLIQSYQFTLTEFDFIQAKARLAIEINGVLPGIVRNVQVELIDAFHPILWKNNKSQNKKTIPQRISLNAKQRMLVISGPNAGGKSITLKTVGLLQLMLQAGLLIPVHPNSKCCFFQQVLSDIGDNQSIENELSTYSYRLQRMNHFLKVANQRTLLLLDEFGTGSDPDLGGALAEVIFEELYKDKSFAVITTHYANIKLKADQLPQAINGCMLFNTETLEPLYRFDLGQPGSSFTFEVAQINGLPKSIIEDAKSRISEQKVKMDRLLSELQKEKNYFTQLNIEHQEAQRLAQEAKSRFDEKTKALNQKLEGLKDQNERNAKLVNLGSKLQQFIDQYTTGSRKKTINDGLLEDVKKYLAVEKGKKEEHKKAERLKKLEAFKSKKPKKIKPELDEYQRHRIIVGSTVKMIATKQSGTVEEIKDDSVTVTFGFARMKVERNKLMWIK